MTVKNPPITLAKTDPPEHLSAAERAAWRRLAPRADRAAAAAGLTIRACDLLAFEHLVTLVDAAEGFARAGRDPGAEFGLVGLLRPPGRA